MGKWPIPTPFKHSTMSRIPTHTQNLILIPSGVSAHMREIAHSRCGYFLCLLQARLAGGDIMGHFTSWISLSLRPKTETKRLNFGLSPMLRLTNRSHASSLTSSAIHRWFRRISLFIFELMKNSAIVQSEVSAKRLAKRWVQTNKKTSLSVELWSQSEFRTRRKSQRKTNPTIKMTHCVVNRYIAWHTSSYPRSRSVGLVSGCGLVKQRLAPTYGKR